MKNINSDVPELCDEHFLLEKMAKLKGLLVKLDEHIEGKSFIPILDVVFSKPKNSNNVGEPPFEWIMMFKLLIL